MVLFHGRGNSSDVFLDHDLSSALHDKLMTLFFIIIFIIIYLFIYLFIYFAHKQKMMNKLFRTMLLSGLIIARFSVCQKQN